MGKEHLCTPQPKMDNNEHKPVHNHTSDFSEYLVASTYVQNTMFSAEIVLVSF